VSVDSAEETKREQRDKRPGYPARFNDITWYRTNVPCMQACPVHTDSGRYVQLIAEGQFEDAFLVARSSNPLASVCGRICAAPCEDACRRGWIDEPITIRPLKRFVTESYGAESARPDTYRKLLGTVGDSDGSVEDPGCSRAWHLSQLRPAPAIETDNGLKVAVIGSGPAGLGCAHDLAVMGYDVTVIEALPELGGMLRYGIPEYRLPRGVIEREAAIIERLGVTFRTGVALTADYNLASLRSEGFKAFFLSVGASRGRALNIPGTDKDGVIKAVDYLLNLNRGYRVDLGKKVIVIGGGSVALDAARTAVREFYNPMKEIEMTAEAVVGQPAMDAARGALRGGASEVHVISLESLAELPASRTVQGKEELHEAQEEGIELHPSWGPRAILGGDRVERVEFVAVKRVFDDDGRFNPVFDESKTMSLATDSVVLAIGQQPDFSFLVDEDGIELGPGRTVKIDPDTLATTAPGVFAGGDAAFGPRIAIEAVANGKQAARSIHRHLQGGLQSPRLHVEIRRIPADAYVMPAGYEKRERKTAPTTATDRRTGIAEVEHVMSEEQARRQAERCLVCHIDTVYDPHRCVLCNRCADVCPEKCLTFVPIEQVEIPEEQRRTAMEQYGHDPEAPLTVLLKDDTACIRCGLCALRCPTDAMTMERFNFVESTADAAQAAPGAGATDSFE
jgi:NADPH-dependent glutamate synthase beta subunit-like oxidoreductase